MELGRPEQLALNKTTVQLINEVDKFAQRVNEFRPLPVDAIKRIDNELIGERVYSSNAIEGNTLDLRETVMILQHGIQGKERKREAMEARNLGQAIDVISDWVSADDPCHTVSRFLLLHKEILHEFREHDPGFFRNVRVMIQGAVHQPPNHSLVQPLIDEVLEYLGQDREAHTVVQAAWAHWAIARIHPFKDGNGRMARLWQDLILLNGRLTCSIMALEDRKEYLDCLGRADEGEFDSLIQLVAHRILTTFEKYLSEIDRSGDEDEEWLKEVVGEADARVDDAHEFAYMKWKKRMEHLSWEFETYSAKVSKASRNIAVQLRSYPIIDRTQWENIRSGVPAQRTWLFVLEFAAKTRARYIFFFGKHYWSDLDQPKERSEDRVCLLISEDDGSHDATRLDELEDTPLSLREIFLVGDSFVRKRRDAATGEDVYDRDISPAQIAKDFIREVTLYRVT